MAALLKFILITILVLYIIKRLARLLLPILFQKVVNKAQEHVNGQFGGYQQYNNNYQKQRPAGKIKIDYIPPKEKEARAADKAGDFIDFEEIR